MKGEISQRMESIKAKPVVTLDMLTEEDFQRCLVQWKISTERCKNKKGKYIEGDKVYDVIGNEKKL